MSLNKKYGEYMDESVKGLVDNATVDSKTNHTTFSADKLTLPKGVTTESIKTHVTLFNDLSAQVEAATGEVARSEYAKNDKLTSMDGTLDLGAFTINAQHHLKQKVGDNDLYGVSTTAVDYIHSEEQSTWLETNRQQDQELAKKLFS